ncbi:MAG: efflux RND transporter periplasmic adaptor subunit [Duncaniella sp.]|nr:efflux RND transporter periplasmic adaptor subunit [Bacteroides sp.]MDE6061748.1 efflux RND transporter periplasmic adaptor subunit [Duncaniella sp.]MDE6431340.1 efflux RND transporter periplasmic adaptor subunit [Duncaniella sp.]MDE6824760.1 efflux RND transporter periplasmic adaptor subunit [Duncaniella sp.]
MLAAVALLPSCSKQQQQMQMPAPEIATITLTPQTADLNSTFPATIKGKTDIDIRPQVTGFITKVHVDEGQHVRKGQVLFTLDQVTFQAAVDQAQAAVNNAQTAVNTAKMTADNKKALLDKNIISEYEYQLSQNSLAQAKAQLANANAALASAKKNLAYTVVTSPSDGVVGTIPNREGSLASPSSAQPLTTVSDNSQVYAYFSLTENDLLNLVGEGERTMDAAIKALPEVRFKMSDGKIYPLEGKVATVSGVIDNNTGASSVRALFNNPQGILRSGATGQIIMPDNKESVIVIPQKATFELQDRRFVYVVNDSNKVVSTPIIVEANNDGKNFVVTSGLQPGQRIAIEGVGTKLSDGMAINPVAPQTQEAAQQSAQQAPAAN